MLDVIIQHSPKKENLSEKFFYNSSASENKKRQNCACTDFDIFVLTEGTPAYEQRKLRSSEKRRRRGFANGVS